MHYLFILRSENIPRNQVGALNPPPAQRYTHIPLCIMKYIISLPLKAHQAHLLCSHNPDIPGYAIGGILVWTILWCILKEANYVV